MSIKFKHRAKKLVLSLLVLSLCIFPSARVTVHALGEAETATQLLNIPQRIVVLPLFAE